MYQGIDPLRDEFHFHERLQDIEKALLYEKGPSNKLDHLLKSLPKLVDGRPCWLVVASDSEAAQLRREEGITTEHIFLANSQKLASHRVRGPVAMPISCQAALDTGLIPRSLGYRGNLMVSPLVLDGELVGYFCMGGYSQDEFGPGSQCRIADILSVRLSSLIGYMITCKSMQKVVSRDSLTGLFNRRELESHLDRMLSWVNRNNETLSIAFLDCDKFKRVNDNHGHEVGDQLLVLVARTLTACLRKSDMAFRYAGDEFVLVLPGTTANQAENLLRRVSERLARTPLDAGGEPLFAQVSSGISSTDLDGHLSPFKMLQLADHRLLQRKRKRKLINRLIPESLSGRLGD
jgi:diguanylate cyclase (GGDEF)-like protein